MKKIIYSGPGKDFVNPSNFNHLMGKISGMDSGRRETTACQTVVCLKGECDGGWIGIYHFEPKNVTIEYFVHNVHPEDFGQLTLTLFGGLKDLGVVEKMILESIHAYRSNR